jgi:hypothetical protein
MDITSLVVGDGSLKRTKTGAWLRLGHAQDQKSFLVWKAALLSEYGSPRLEEYKPRVGQIYFQMRWKSQPEWGEIYDKLYQQSRKIVRADLFADFTDLDWAIFFGDDGTIHRDLREGFNASDRAIFAGSSKVIKEPKALKEIIEVEFGKTSFYEVGTNFQIRLNAEASQNLGLRINPYLSTVLQKKVILPRDTKKRGYCHS